MDKPAPSADRLTDPVALRLGYMLRRASAAMMAGLGIALAEIGLRPVEGTILILVGANPGCIQSDVGRMLGIKRANMVPLVAALAGRGLVDKSPVDGRSLALSLTPAGELLRMQVDAIMDAHETRFERLLAGRDIALLREALRLIAEEGEAGAE
ncbi:hypothetical protein ASE85_21495 [Sphingobium sp. Leaf26]|uniref:MarR family winged helix-turn-helix transcriptional regulator n=1 Tax=Sphingobium sp. Leaf26 TaxID=1735693 RepID=UPI0006F4E2A1|nr:MarR family transcriptional regulator [Sphingobium sp. Leaf26]KQN02326.1 hypothetical protein ASE85_21495 [Sphingobium sp. Leaf26]